MAVLTISPWVALALIFGLLLVIGLVAFSRRAAENLLRFFKGLLDLYQCWLQLRRASHSSLEQNAENPEPHRDPSDSRAGVTNNTAYALSALQPQTELQQQHLHASDIMGEPRR
jgi:hypothetical protein